METTVTIEVKDFGPLHNVSFDVAPMTIFMGNSGLGKSYANYLFYYLISKFISSDDLCDLLLPKVKEEKTEFDVALEEIENWLHEGVQDYMRRFLGDSSLLCDVNFVFNREYFDKNYRISYTIMNPKKSGKSDEKRLFDVLTMAVSINQDKYRHLFLSQIGTGKEPLNVPDSICSCLQRELQHSLGCGYLHRRILFPPGRGTFAGESYSMKSKIASSVGMYDEYLEGMENAMYLYRKNEKPLYTDSIAKLIDGQLMTEKNTQYLMFKDGRRLSLSAAASSIKEVSPLIYALNNCGDMNYYLCIEEPEAHMHPQMQVNLMDLLAQCLNHGMWISFTSHSDYIMQRVNQLVKLGSIGKKDENKCKALCETLSLRPDSCLDKEKIKVYYFHDNDGGVKVETVPVSDRGFQMKTFFDIVEKMENVEDVLNDAFDEIKTERNA